MRWVAFLRGVSPMNAKMPALQAAFEQAGFGHVRTLLSSGNVAFDARAGSQAALQRKCEAAMQAALGRSFTTFVRRSDALAALVADDPFRAFDLPTGAKCVLTFLREVPAAPPRLPVSREGATILALRGDVALAAYQPVPGNPVFMALIEKTFGADQTTRTWDTVRKCAAA